MRHTALLLCLTFTLAHGNEPAHAPAAKAAAPKVAEPKAAEPVHAAAPAPASEAPAPRPGYVLPSHARPAAPHKTRHKAAATHAPAAHGSAHSGGGHWGYEKGNTGPESWGNMSPAFSLCKEGKEQSPVNITTSYAQEMDKIKFSYGMTKITVVNNGHTIQLNIDPGSFIEVFGSKYQLLQFHFHAPSEEAIGGIRYPMVAHLVHKSEDGKLAVIAALIQQGAQDNPLIETLWSKMPEEHNETRTFDKLTYSPASLLPLDQSFYTFMGSLTTPPCSEGVRWLVMKNPLSISARQIARFKKEFPMNARPIQPLNARNVMEGT